MVNISRKIYDIFTCKMILERFKCTLRYAKLRTRPKASLGVWLSFLLPLAIVTGAVRYHYPSLRYKNAAYFSAGLLLSSVMFIVQNCLSRTTQLVHRNIKYFLSFVLTLVLLHYRLLKPMYPIKRYTPEALSFSIVSSGLATYGFYIGLPMLIRAFPLSFTYGEAAVVTQAILLLIFATLTHITYVLETVPSTNVDYITTILQIGILGLCLLCVLLYKYEILRGTKIFYLTTWTLLWAIILFPLIYLLKMDPITWIIKFLDADDQRLYMVAYWIVCVIIASKSILRQINIGKRANTSRRKVFHFLAVAVFFPAILKQCTLLYVASGAVFGIFIILEILRILYIPPLGSVLQDGFSVFVDEKDVAGGIAFSPIYLLVGFSTPIWIHPHPCDHVDSAGYHILALLSGLLTIGVGDTVASMAGSRIGKHKWPGTKKTFEGTLASILIQHLVLLGLLHFGYIYNEQALKAIIAIFVTSITEAMTDQVDNLVLPLLAYIIMV